MHPTEQKPSTKYAAECQARYERTGFADFDLVADAAAAMQEANRTCECDVCPRSLPVEVYVQTGGPWQPAALVDRPAGPMVIADGDDRPRGPGDVMGILDSPSDPAPDDSAITLPRNPLRGPCR